MVQAGSLPAVSAGPAQCGAHPATDIGSLAVLQFSAAPRPGVVHLGGAGGGVLLESQADLIAYDRMFEQLRMFALSPSRSAHLLRDLTAR